MKNPIKLIANNPIVNNVNLQDTAVNRIKIKRVVADATTKIANGTLNRSAQPKATAIVAMTCPTRKITMKNTINEKAAALIAIAKNTR